MNLNLFRTYVRVVETQNLSRTADEMGLSQPAITKQIQALEDLYGVLLLERSGRKLKTTEAGETLYQCARDILKVMEKTDKAMEEVTESRRGSLFLGASNIPGEYILPQVIKGFKDNFPNIKILMDVADTEKIFSRVAEREIDVGVVGAWINTRKVDGFQWLEDELVVILPVSHRLANREQINLHDLLEERWIFREKGSGTRKAVEDLLLSRGIRKESLNIFMEAGSTEAALALVEAGTGLTVASSWTRRNVESHRGLKVVPLADTGARRSFYVIYPRQKVRRRSVEQFIEYIRLVQVRPGD